VIPRAAAALLVIYSTLVIQRAMPDLPERIPTRFDIHGHPLSVSRPETIWLFLAAQALLVGLFLALPYLARRSPRWISLGQKRLNDFPAPLRNQILEIIEGACGWLAVAFAFFMALLIRGIIRAALEMRTGPSLGLILAFLGGLLAILGISVWKYLQVGRRAVPATAVGGTIGTVPRPPQAPPRKK
jgi:uncharacterized membrane protein